ncbi:MAG: hypothetical protein ACYS99_22020, partial [Planctomycetota bacterium]
FGRPVKILDGNGDTLLTGVILPFGAGRIDVHTCLAEKNKFFEFSLRVKRLVADSSYELRIDGVQALTFEADSEGCFEQKLKSKDADPFFSLFPTISDLAGLAFEIRTSTGTVVYSGHLPG